LVGKIKTDCHPFTLLVRLLQIFWKICCVHVKANLRVLRVVSVLNKIWPTQSYVHVKGLLNVVTRWLKLQMKIVMKKWTYNSCI
jgi:hypothetical protein